MYKQDQRKDEMKGIRLQIHVESLLKLEFFYFITALMHVGTGALQSPFHSLTQFRMSGTVGFLYRTY